MKNGKRILSLILSVTMVLTTLTIGLTVIASATLVDESLDEAEETYDIDSSVALLVPEVYYLEAQTASWITSTQAAFEYAIADTPGSTLYDDVTLSSSYSNTYAYIRFDYEDLDTSDGNPYVTFRFLSSITSSSPTVYSTGQLYVYGSGGNTTWSAGSSTSVTMLKTSNYGTSYYARLYIPSCKSPSLSASTTGFYIEYTVHYTDAASGQELTITAYSYVYKPYVVPYGVSIIHQNTRGDDSTVESISWVTGVHSISVSSNSSSASQRYFYWTTESLGGYGFLPFLSKTNYNTTGGGAVSSNVSATWSNTSGTHVNNGQQLYQIFSNSTAAYNWFRTTGYNPEHDDQYAAKYSSSTKTTSSTATSSTTFDLATCTHYRYKDGKSSGDSYNYVILNSLSTGTLYVDSSRYTNLSQIPNLGIGLLITCMDDEDDGGAWYVADATGSDYLFSATLSTGHNSSASDNMKQAWLLNDATFIAGEMSDSGYSSYLFGSSVTFSSIATKQTIYNGWCTSSAYRVVYGGTWVSSISNSDSTTTTHTYKSVAFGDDSDYTLNVAYLNLDVTTYDKSELRAAVKEAQSYFSQLGITDYSFSSLYYNTSSTLWTNFVNYYKQACNALVTLDSTVSTSYAALLESALEALLEEDCSALKSGTVYEVNVALYPTDSGYYAAALLVEDGYNDFSITSNGVLSVSYDYSDFVTFTTYDFTGYTYSSTMLSTSRYTGYLTDLSSMTTYLSDSSYVTSYYQFKTLPTQVFTSTSTAYLSTLSTSSSAAGKYLTQSHASTVTLTTGVYSISIDDDGTDAVFARMADSVLYIYNFYIADTYTVTYDPGSVTLSDGTTKTGDGTSFSNTYYYGLVYDVLDLSETDFSLTGYSFSGWTEDPDATTSTYIYGTDTGTFSNLGDTTLYAVWGANPYYLTYDANNGTGDTYEDSETHYYDTAFTVLDIDDSELGWSYEHYTFTGWSTTSDGSDNSLYSGGSSVLNLAQDYKASVTLYAQWLGNECTVVFLDYDGTVLGTYTVNYGNSVTAPTTYTKLYSVSGDQEYHYVFSGWAIVDDSDYETVLSSFTSGYTPIEDDENITYIRAQYSASAHVFTGVITLETTCNYPGEMTYTCSVCYYTYTEEIPCIDHVDSDRDGYCDNESERYTEELGFVDNTCGYYIGLYINTGGYDDEDAEPAGQRNITLTNSLGLTFSFRAYDDEDGEDIQDITGSAIIIYWLNKPLYFTISGYDDENWVPVIRVNGAEVEADSDTGEYTVPAGLSLVTITVEVGYYDSETGETSNFFDLLLAWLTKVIAAILKLFGLD